MSVRRRSRASSRPSIHDIEVPTDPNTFTWPERSRKKFVQLVALQCLVTPAPITTEHSIALEQEEEREESRRRRRCLPPKTEREIADHFAFLAAGDGSGAACCIEEVPRGGEGEREKEGAVRLRFRIAMNEGVPREVLEGLRGVVREVGRRADEDHTDSDIKATVWAHVLDLEKAKVHADLVDRFTRGTRPLSAHFEEALAPRHDPDSGLPLPTDDAHPVLQKIYDLCIRVTSTTDLAQCTRDLDRLLDTCYRFRSSRIFKSGLKAAVSRRQIVQMVEKLGRYRTASNALVAAARKFPDLFTGAQVDTVPALPALDEKAASGFKGVYIGDVAQDLTGSATEAICMSRLRTITDLSNEKLAGKFQDLCQSVPTTHAEIQLVKFYEENAHIDRPGFIGCSKKSCFLCGLFLQLHRRFAVSKAHQNIYHAWTVPTIRCASPENAVMLDFVVEKMARIIEDSCKKMLWEKPEETSPHHKALIATLPPPVSHTPVNAIISTTATTSSSATTATTFAGHPPSSSGFITPRSPLSPISPCFSRPSTAASNLQNVRASARQTPKPQQQTQHEQEQEQEQEEEATSKLTDSSGDSSSPEPSSPHLSSESSCTSVSEDSSKESNKAHMKRQTRSKHVVDSSVAAAAVAATVERMPAITAADAPPLPQRSASRARECPPAARPGSVARSTRKRGSTVEVPKAEQPAVATTTTITRSQSVRTPRKTAPAAPHVTPKAPMRSASVARRPAAAPEIPARRGHVRSASAMEVRRVPAASDTESPSPRTASKPFGPLRRANTNPTDTTSATATATSKSSIPVPRSVSRSNRKATPPRSPSAVRYIRMENPVRHEYEIPSDQRPPSPGHITASLLRRESPISVARFETAMAMAVTSVTGSPTMVELPPYRGSSSSEAGSTSTRTTPRGSPNVPGRHPSRSRAQKRMSPLSVERKADAIETVDSSVQNQNQDPAAVTVTVAAPAVVVAVAAGLGLKKSSSKISLRESFNSSAPPSSIEAVVERAGPSTPSPSLPPLSLPLSITIPPSPTLLPTDPDDSPSYSCEDDSPHPITVATPHGITIIDSSEESTHPLPPPKRTLTERRGRALKRVDPTTTATASPANSSKLPRISAAAIDRKRAAIDRATADFVQESGLTAQRKRGMTIADVVQASGFQAQLSRGIPPYHSDTETSVRARLRGGALSTISSSSEAAPTAAATSSTMQRRRQKRRLQETEYTLYLAEPDHDDRTLGAKIFSGRLSDNNGGASSAGEAKQRVGYKVRTALRPAEREINGMRVKEVVKSLEEMVLDIFFPDAVLRLEVMWDGDGSGSGSGSGGGSGSAQAEAEAETA